jgi:hypothetical protein
MLLNRAAQCAAIPVDSGHQLAKRSSAVLSKPALAFHRGDESFGEGGRSAASPSAPAILELNAKRSIRRNYCHPVGPISRMIDAPMRATFMAA